MWLCVNTCSCKNEGKYESEVPFLDLCRLFCATILTPSTWEIFSLFWKCLFPALQMSASLRPIYCRQTLPSCLLQRGKLVSYLNETTETLVGFFLVSCKLNRLKSVDWWTSGGRMSNQANYLGWYYTVGIATGCYTTEVRFIAEADIFLLEATPRPAVQPSFRSIA